MLSAMNSLSRPEKKNSVKKTYWAKLSCTSSIISKLRKLYFGLKWSWIGLPKHINRKKNENWQGEDGFSLEEKSASNEDETHAIRSIKHDKDKSHKNNPSENTE